MVTRPTTHPAARWLKPAATALACLLGAGNGAESQTLLQNDLLRAMVEMRVIDGVTVSPDGKLVAYRVLTRSIDTNKSQVSWFAVPADGSGTPRPLGQPAEPIWVPMFDAPDPGAAIWTPDSRSILVRQIEGPGIQIFQLGVDGSSRAITDDPADVVAFAIGEDRQSLVYQVRNTRAAIAAAQDREEQRGIRMDRGVSPEGLRLTKNFRIGSRTTSIRFSGHSAAEEAFEGPLRSIRIPLPLSAGGLPTATASVPYLDPSSAADRGRTIAFKGGELRISSHGRASKFVSSPMVELTVTTASGKVERCEPLICRGPAFRIRGVTVLPATGEVVFLQEAASSGSTMVYGWQPHTARIRNIFDAKGSLDGGSVFSGPCSKSGDALICVFADPTTPPRLVRLDLGTASMRVLADPNAPLSRSRFGATRMLSWMDAKGRVATGTLFLPRDGSRPVPLVITTNACRGFPRGGASNIIAEHVLAANGFAALCVAANRDSSLDPDVDSGRSILGPHRAALDSYEAIIDQLSREGLIDRAKVGIAGHSFSANVTAYGISHSSLFAAAVMGGSISIDASSYDLTTLTRDSYRAALWTSFLNLPPRTPDSAAIWNSFAPSLNAASIRTPLLIEVPESEYAMSLELYGSINRAGGTTDMYVFPEEGHWLGRSPIHEYWRSARALAWFKFWLKGDKDLGAGMESERALWSVMKAEKDRSAGSP